MQLHDLFSAARFADKPHGGGSVDAWVAAFDRKRAEIVLYCGGGFRSALAADNLRKMGYTNVASMDGGIRAWREAGYPIEKG